MKEAYHFNTKKVVHAEDCNYEEFYGVFECRKCNKPVFLRKAYITSNATKRPATFVHYEGEEECKNRVSWKQENKNFNINNYPLSQGQFIKIVNSYILETVELFSIYGKFDIRGRINDFINKPDQIPCNFLTFNYLLYRGLEDRFNTEIKLLSSGQIQKLILQKCKNFELRLQNCHENLERWIIIDRVYKNIDKLTDEEIKWIIFPKTISTPHIKVNTQSNENDFSYTQKIMEKINKPYYKSSKFDSDEKDNINYLIHQQYQNVFNFLRIFPSLDEKIQKKILFWVFLKDKKRLCNYLCCYIRNLAKSFTNSKDSKLTLDNINNVLETNSLYFNFQGENILYDNNIKLFFDKLYNGELESESVISINSLIDSLIEIFGYIDWNERFFEWQEKRSDAIQKKENHELLKASEKLYLSIFTISFLDEQRDLDKLQKGQYFFPQGFIENYLISEIMSIEEVLIK